MIREFFHFFRALPWLARMSAELDQASMYTLLMERAERAGLADLSTELVRDLRGDVLEIGCGTGRMFRYYPVGVRLRAIEPFGEFLELARSAPSTVPVSLQEGSAMDLPFEDDSFDAIVFGNVLCSVPSVDRVLAEVNRVLRPDGHLRLIEHVISDDAFAALFMHLLNPIWRILNKQGCNMNVHAENAVRRAGFRIRQADRHKIYIEGLPPFPSRFLRAEKGMNPAASRVV